MRIGALRRAMVVGASLGYFALASCSSSDESRVPPDEPLFPVAGFVEPLVPDGETTDVEDGALIAALTDYAAASRKDDSLEALRVLSAFVEANPDSPWKFAVETNLGMLEYRRGYFKRAFAMLERAWSDGKSATGPRAKALADRAVGELLKMHARVGHHDDLQRILTEIDGRVIEGGATELVVGAREAKWVMEHDHGYAYLCGPAALRNVLRALESKPETFAFLDLERSGPQGYTLAQVGELGERAKVPLRLVHREEGGTVPVPSVVHWQVNHYSAIVEAKNGLYHVIDPTFDQGDFWIDARTIDEESSGFFAIPKGVSGDGLRDATAAEAGAVHGMGVTTQNNPRATSRTDKRKKKQPADPSNPTGPDPCAKGMCDADATEMLVSLNLTDTPIGFKPATGPAAFVNFSYNQREASQPQNDLLTSIGSKWSLGVISYIDCGNICSPTNYTRMTHVQPGGGSEVLPSMPYLGESIEPSSRARLSAMMIPNPPNHDVFVGYRLVFPNGAVHEFKQFASDPLGGSQRIFLSRILDPQGHWIDIDYEAKIVREFYGPNPGCSGSSCTIYHQFVQGYRVAAIRGEYGDALLTFAYGDATNLMRLTSITDKFGRHADLTYQQDGKLAAISDVMQFTSSFSYDANGFLSAMTTPYGTSKFAGGEGTSTNSRWLEMTNPAGETERLEFTHQSGIPASDPSVPYNPADERNQFLDRRNTFYWDPRAYAAAIAEDPKRVEVVGGKRTNAVPFPYRKAFITHFLHTHDNMLETSPLVESTRPPLDGGRTAEGETRTWYDYDFDLTVAHGILQEPIHQQPSGFHRMLEGKAIAITKFLVTESANNLFGVNAGRVDPMGRTVLADFYAGGIDVQRVKVSGKVATTPTVVASYTWDSKHRMKTYTNASGQTTTFTYDADEQLVQLQSPKSKTSLTYYPPGDPAARQLRDVRQADGQVILTLTYDTKGRVATSTDAEGYVRSFSYDDLDRLTRVTYPDGTTEETVYDRMHLGLLRNRAGKQVRFSYDGAQRVQSMLGPYVGKTLTAIAQAPTVRFGYWPNGELATLTDERGNVTSFDYDIEGRLKSKKYADATSLTYEYKPQSGWIDSVTQPSGAKKSFTYNLDGSVASFAYTGGASTAPVSYGYGDVFARLESMSDATGTTTFEYGLPGQLGALRLKSETGPFGRVAYSWDADGRPLTVGVGTYAYDTVGRARTYTLADKVKTTFFHPASNSPRVSVIENAWNEHLGATTTRLLYDDAQHDRRLTFVGHHVSFGVSGERKYDYKASTSGLDQIVNTPFSNTGWAPDVTVLERDTADHLVRVKRPASGVDPTAPLATVEQFVVDKAGNSTPGTTGATFNAANQPDALVGETFSYSGGNTTSDGTRTFGWDAENRLVSVAFVADANRHVEIGYDGLGRRVSIAETLNGVQKKRYFQYCGGAICRELDAAKKVVREFGPYAEVERDSTGNIQRALSYLFDGTGNVRDVYDVKNETYVGSQDFSAYGVVTRSFGGVMPERRFGGMRWNEVAGIYLSATRAYDPRAGRWLSRDLLGEVGGLNLYGYAFANPFNWSDPSGLACGKEAAGTNGSGPIPRLATEILGAIGLGGVLQGTLGGATAGAGAAAGAAAGAEAGGIGLGGAAAAGGIGLGEAAAAAAAGALGLGAAAAVVGAGVAVVKAIDRANDNAGTVSGTRGLESPPINRATEEELSQNPRKPGDKLPFTEDELDEIEYVPQPAGTVNGGQPKGDPHSNQRPGGALLGR